MASLFPDFSALERLADEHLNAWRGLADSAAAVAGLPMLTAQRLFRQELGAASHDASPSADVRERSEAKIWQARIEAQQALIDELRRAYAQLELQLGERVGQAQDDQKRLLYSVLEPLLTQLPIVRHAVALGQAVDVADLLALLGPLDAALAELGFQPIGEVGERVAYDPAAHQSATGTAPEAGAPVTVKHVGYTLDGHLLRRARVSSNRSPTS